jgi:hypothetical protein
MRLTSVELLSNLIWILVALALWALWLTKACSARRARLYSAGSLQLIALAVLTMILLPVISVSDDLQAARNPAEVERIGIKNHLHHLLQADPPPPAPVLFASVVSLLLLIAPRTIALLDRPAAMRPHLPIPIHAIESRPPPVG